MLGYKSGPSTRGVLIGSLIIAHTGLWISLGPTVGQLVDSRKLPKDMGSIQYVYDLQFGHLANI